MSSIYLVADLLDKEIVLRRYANQNRWTASFEDGEVKDGGVLIGAYGNGESPLEAIENYVAEIAGKAIVFNAYNGAVRTEFVMPKNLYS